MATPLLQTGDKTKIRAALAKMGVLAEAYKFRDELKKTGIPAHVAWLRMAQKWMPEDFGEFGSDLPPTLLPGEEKDDSVPSRRWAKAVKRMEKREKNQPDWERLRQEAGDSLDVRASYDWAAANAGNKEAKDPPGPMAVVCLMKAFKDPQGFLADYTKLTAKDEAAMAALSQTRKATGLLDNLLDQCGGLHSQTLPPSTQGPPG